MIKRRRVLTLILCIGTIAICIIGWFIYDNMPKEISENSLETYHFELIQNNHYEGIYSNEEMGDYQLCFRGEVSQFSDFTFGKGKGLYSGQYLKINNQEIQIYKALDSSLIANYDNTIVIKDYISICICVDLKCRARVEISTNGGSIILEDVPWDARMGTIFVETDMGTQMSDCTMSYYANGWNTGIWLFGDSYFNCYKPDRWTSYLTLNDYDNFMLNGYPGRASDVALKSLKTTLQYDKPKEIIWCMGMNDGDSEDTINDNWLASVKEIMAICEENDITLVLATIPTCPTVNNDYKNQYVRDSGYRYIDFANAVGADKNIEWYEGMLEEGEAPVHPTELGARALYSEAVATCPELMQK